MEDIIKQIKERKAELQQAKENLKAHFIGLDEQINYVMDMIETWYVMPELITRPVIVNIWGMTGTGKTDLIRRLARELEMLNKFFELQMDTKKSSWVTSIEESFDMAGIEENEPAIVLFDEMQRFRTKGHEGEQVDNDLYQDIWMLLSDGTFANNAGKMNKIQAMLFEEMYSKERNDWQKKQEAEEPESKTKDTITTKQEEPNYKFKNCFWSSKNLKKRLKLIEPIEEIMTWSPEKKIQVIRDRSNDDTVNKGADYNKLLIFVCGNLDEAYSMASSVDEVDIDADVFHQFSKKITLVDIKHALTRRFQPEQIARLGNNHIVYSAMSKANYIELIKRTVQQSAKNFANISGVDIIVEQSVYDAIYRNGVFPTQGVRPIFTTISSLFEANIPAFLVEAMQKKVSLINIRFDKNTDHLIANFNDICIRKKVKCDIDSSKKKRNIDAICKTAVHEAGHAALYCILFGIAPTQVVSTATSKFKAGFMMPHKHGTAKETIEKIISVCYGGQVAESMIFGDSLTTGGCAMDISSATYHANDMVRNWEQSKRVGKVCDLVGVEGSSYITDIDNTNNDIESILQKQKLFAIEILNKHAPFHLALTTALIDNHKLEKEEVVEIAAKFGLDIEAHDSSYEICPNYVNKLEAYKNKINKGS